MRKLTAGVITSLSYFYSAAAAMAAPADGFIDLTPRKPAQGIDPTTSPQTIITNLLTIVFVVAILLVLFFLILGAFKWITSGGDKEAVGKARGTIVNALIGLAILALAFVIARVAGQIVGVDFNNLKIPALDTNVIP